MPEGKRHSPDGRAHRLPGDEGIWVLIFGDMIVFIIFFATFFVYRLQNYDVFAAGHYLLDVRLGILNTLLLLTSSLFVALATRTVRRGEPSAARWVAAAIGCGACFCLVKAFEYGHKIANGITLNTTEFFTLYYMYTGIHLVHVLVGIGILTLVFFRIRNSVEADANISFIETGGSFWHLVDLLWIVMFPLFYLIR